MKKNLLFVIVALFVFIGYVYAADWVQIDDKKYLDESSLSEYHYSSNFNKDLLLSVWIKFLNDGSPSWKEIEKYDGKRIWYSKSLKIINCTNRELATKTIVDYDLKGNVAYSYENNLLEWHSVVPETVGEVVYSYVCSAQNTSTTIVPDKNNVITTSDGTKVQVKYHKKLFPLNR